MENRDDEKAQISFIMEASRKSMDRVRTQMARLAKVLELQALKSNHDDGDSDDSSDPTGPLGSAT